MPIYALQSLSNRRSAHWSGFRFKRCVRNWRSFSRSWLLAICKDLQVTRESTRIDANGPRHPICFLFASIRLIRGQNFSLAKLAKSCQNSTSQNNLNWGQGQKVFSLGTFFSFSGAQ